VWTAWSPDWVHAVTDVFDFQCYFQGIISLWYFCIGCYNLNSVKSVYFDSFLDWKLNFIESIIHKFIYLSDYKFKIFSLLPYDVYWIAYLLIFTLCIFTLMYSLLKVFGFCPLSMFIVSTIFPKTDYISVFRWTEFERRCLCEWTATRQNDLKLN
jgi:hypothetical protein